MDLKPGDEIAFTFGVPREALSGKILKKYYPNRKILVEDSNGVRRIFSTASGYLKAGLQITATHRNFKLLPIEEAGEMLKRRELVEKVNSIKFSDLPDDTLNQILQIVYPKTLESASE